MNAPINLRFKFIQLMAASVLMKSLTAFAADPIIIDSRHYSNVFGEIRNFRIFLPPGYYDNPQSRYPVIYYYHGWSQRYFGSTSIIAADEGNSNNGDNIANFVASHDVIVVKPDGYNRSPDQPYDLRPYNVGPVETYRQYPIYIPELIQYIDANFRTIADRNHRAISGLSMGGFMTFWIGGKYPDLFCAAGNFCGSAEFVVGPRDFPVEYRHLDMYNNYAGMNVRLNYGNRDFIRCYHRDMNRIWSQVMDNYEYKVYDAEHTTCGLGEMFAFIINTFNDPPEKPEKWGHIDVYPSFSVWDYDVSTDRNLPGFTVLEDVDVRGFRCSVREFLPDGEIMPFVNVLITTPSIYGKNQSYIINDMDIKKLSITQKTIRSDHAGRLKIIIDGSIHEIGINKEIDESNICIASFEVENIHWATTNKNIPVRVKLLNKGLGIAEGVKATLSATKGGTSISVNETAFGSIAENQMQKGRVPFIFNVPVDSIEIVKFKLTIVDKNQHEWTDFFEIKLRKEQPEIKDFVIADGREFMVTDAGIDSIRLLLGNGNGDGIANPGESFTILVKDHGKYWRTEAYSSSKYVNPYSINVRMSDYWGNYDHVGGSAKYTVPMIASNCPEGQDLNFYVEYWLPDYPDHIIQKGRIRINVTGKDIAPPLIGWVKISGDNTIHAKVCDGSALRSVKARLQSKATPERILETELKDDGKEGDACEKDNVYSRKMLVQGFDLFNIEIEAVDLFGNIKTQKSTDIYVLQ
jgi:poly(3-hydroxybutyrate) depolymerase